jgi:hypothetical protein
MAMASPNLFSEFASGAAAVLPPDVNSVILENLAALVGPATGTLLDAMPGSGAAAADSRIGPKVN